MHAYELVPEQYLTERGLSSNPEEILSAGIFQEPIGNEAVLQEMFEEVKAGFVGIRANPCRCRVFRPVRGAGARWRPGGVRSSLEMAQSPVGRIGPKA